MQGHQTFQEVLNGVKAWIPSEAHGHEKEFQKELQAFLDDYLNGQQSGGFGMMGDGEYVVSRERGNARSDVVVDDVVGIELKRELSNSQTKKLRGQIEEYADNYNYVIACACGIDDMDGWRSLKNKYEGQSGFGMDMTEVAFVHKRKEDYGKEPSEVQGGGGGLLGGSDGWL